jgi:hypothetical protein
MQDLSNLADLLFSRSARWLVEANTPADFRHFDVSTSREEQPPRQIAESAVRADEARWRRKSKRPISVVDSRAGKQRSNVKNGALYPSHRRRGKGNTCQRKN